MAKKTKDIELDPKKVPQPKQTRLTPAAADRILEKVDRLTAKK